jgi:lysophospholipase L1-like esterase
MRILSLALAGLLFATPASSQDAAPRFEKEVLAYEAADLKSPPPKGQIVFAGSSSIVDWDAGRYFPDLRIVNRGLWGSALADAVRLVDRLILPHAPRTVVLYAGDNDIDAGMTTENVAVQFERFVRAIHAKLPQTRIVYIGIKPSPQRWITIDRMRAANAMIRQFCSRDDRLAFIDVDGVMLGWDEKPRAELYMPDGLHLSAQGYQLWTMLLRPFLAGSQ